MGRGGSWETWKDQGIIDDIEQGGGAQRYFSHLLETFEQGMGKEGPWGTGQTAWWSFTGLVTNLSLSFSMPNMFIFTHVSASGLVPSLFFHGNLGKQGNEDGKGST